MTSTPSPSIFSKQAVCQEAFNWVVEHYSNQDLLDFVLSDNGMKRKLSSGGFHLTLANIRSKTILFRLTQYKIPLDLLDNLYLMDGPWRTIIRILSIIDEKWLLANWRKLMDDFDCPQDIAFSFSRLESPAVKRLGERLLKISSVWCPVDRPAVTLDSPLPPLKELLLAATASLCKKTFIPSSESDPPPPQTQPQPTDEQKKEAPNEEALSKRLREKLQKEQAKRHELQREFNDFQQKARENDQALHNKIAELSQAIVEAQDSAAVRLRKQQIEHDALLNQFLEQHFGSYDNLAVKTEQAQSTSESLLQTIEKTIEEQNHLDAKHGLKSRLRAQKETLENALGKLKAITLDSVVVHPAIRQLIPQTERQIAEIQNALDSETDELPLTHTAQQLYLIAEAIRVNTPETEQEISQLQSFIENNEQHGLIQPDEKETLFSILEAKRRLHNNINQLKNSHSLPKGAETEKILHQNKKVILVMTQFLADLPSVDIVIDACNVILKSDSPWERIMNTTPQHGFSAASKAFIERCRKNSAFFHSVTLVFDSSVNQISTIETEGNLTVIYARRIQEQHNADLFIKDKIAALHETSDKIWLVTDDSELKYSVVDDCNGYVTPEAFTNFILG